MTVNQIRKIDQPWPESDLEHVGACPYCGSLERAMAYNDVQDWSFYCAPGKWTYWDCTHCKSLYLDPRPTLQTISAVYANYYTHTSANPHLLMNVIKDRIRNECWSHKLHVDLKPRLNLPKILGGLLSLIETHIRMPSWMPLATLPKGCFMDVGCGAGQIVAVAKQLGWDAMGLEVDPAAANVAKAAGLNVVEASYEALLNYPQQFDCIICSHVLEHVYAPRDLLEKIKQAIKPDGVLLISLPNSLSALRRHFGIHWRGLEAPRHLAIPSESQLTKLLVELGFSVRSLSENVAETAEESYRIQRGGVAINRQDIAMAKQLNSKIVMGPSNNDLIKLVCKMDAHKGCVGS